MQHSNAYCMPNKTLAIYTLQQVLRRLPSETRSHVQDIVNQQIWGEEGIFFQVSQEERFRFLCSMEWFKS